LRRPIERIDARHGYYELGLRSAALLELAGRVGGRFGVAIPPTLLFEYPSIESLAQHLIRELGVGIASRNAVRCSINNLRRTGRHRDHRNETAVSPAPPTGGVVEQFASRAGLHHRGFHRSAGRTMLRRLCAHRPARRMSRWGGFIEDAACFDADFFRISPVEAESMDPQERLFLEVCWEAIEDAGYYASCVGIARGERRGIGQ